MIEYNDSNIDLLLDHPWYTPDGSPECWPRRTVCGSSQAAAMGLVPVLDYPDELVDWADAKEIIDFCHRQQLFPFYHQQAHGLNEYWNQNGLPYCWAWGCACSVMDARAAEGQEPILLAPNSLGWLVNWRSQGFFVDETLVGASQRGIAPASAVPNVHSRNPSTFASDWQEQAMQYRPFEWWDTRKDGDVSMLRQMLTILRTGRSGSVAFNWWGHALTINALEWDESVQHNVKVWLRNSHNEKDCIKLSGSRMIPDEFFGVRSCIHP